MKILDIEKNRESMQTDTDHVDYKLEQILLVDDEENVREPTAEMLEYFGFTVQTAPDGPEALAKLKRGSFTFLITDMKMGEMDGLDLIKAVRRDYPDISIIAMTGYSKEYTYMDVVNAGATDFINKPFAIQELEAKVRRAVIERNTREELNLLSITDDLTGLYNQRYFYTRLKTEVTRALRQNNKLGLLMMDLDNFKDYNDQYGHLRGDRLLEKLGKLIGQNIRQGVDLAFRYGGDEFAVILIDADNNIAQQIADRIITAVEKDCGVGVSVGFGTFSEDMSWEELISAADEYLYEAKRKRNR